VLDTAFRRPDGDAVAVFYDDARRQLTDWGETFHQALAAGVPVDDSA